MDRAQLEAMALEKISKMQTVPAASFDRAELERLAIEKLSGSGQVPINSEREASLGFGNRAQYAIEPIQSNRKALLIEKYGQDNVIEKDGELYLNQNGEFLPVNKDGVSTADFADIGGAIPEMAGGLVGGVGGFFGGAGAGAIPGAIAGGVAGSAIRQGASALLGTPQVATGTERAVEAGTSGIFSGVGAGVGIAAKSALNKAKPGITQIIKNLKGAGKEATSSTAETLTKTVSKTASEMDGVLTPNFNQQTAQGISGEVADQSGREVVEAETKKLNEIALRENIPAPTYAQAAQGKALIAEAKILDTPLISGKVRKTVDGQLKAIKDNLEGLTGKFIDVESDAFEVGAVMREMAESSIEATKKASSELYQQVEEEGAEAMIGKRTFFNKFRDKAGELGLINPDLSKASYAADSSFTRDTFNTLQSVLFDGIDALKNTKSDKIRFESANALRKTVKNYAEELKATNPNASRLLKNFGKELDDTVEATLNREAPKLGEKFKEANRGWYKFKTDEELLESITKGGNLDDEKVVKTVMSGTKNIQKMKDLIGEERVKEIGKTYVRDLLAPLGKSGVGRADSALTAIRKQRAQIESALGSDAYGRLVDNLHFLNRTGQPLNVARASLYNILDNRGAGLKDLTLKVVGTAKTIAESKGMTTGKAISGKVFETTGKVVDKATTQKNISNAANILGDDSQRSLSHLPEYNGGNVTEREKEIQRRKRAISGSK